MYMYTYIHTQIYRYIYTNTYMHALSFDKNRGHKFEGELGGVYGRIRSGKREQGNVIRI